MAKTKSRERGRPRANPELIRRNRVVTLLTDKEFERLREIADEEGSSVSALVHKAVLQLFRRNPQ